MSGVGALVVALAAQGPAFPIALAPTVRPLIEAGSIRVLCDIQESVGQTVWLVGPSPGEVEYFVTRTREEPAAAQEQYAVEVHANPLREATATAQLPPALEQGLAASPKLLKSVQRLSMLKAMVASFAVDNGGYPSEKEFQVLGVTGPQDLVADQATPASSAIDPDGYGNRVLYEPGGATRVVPTRDGSFEVYFAFKLLTLGADGRIGTADDLAVSEKDFRRPDGAAQEVE